MTRARATLTLFLGLPQGSMGFASPSCLYRSRVAPPRMLVSAAWSSAGRSLGGGQSLRGLRRRRPQCLVASMSTSEGTETKSAAEGQTRLPLQNQPASSQERPQQRKPPTRKRLTSTGGLKSLPIVTPSVELLSHANRKSKKVSQDMTIKNARNRSRKWVAERMDMLGKSASKPLGDIVRRYKHQLPILHPFEATLADLTVRAREKTGERTLQSVLDDVNEFRKVALEISKTSARQAKLGERKTEIMQTMDDGYATMEDHFLANGSVLEDLTEVQKALRGLPIVQLHLPTVVLASKSSTLSAPSVAVMRVHSVLGQLLVDAHRVSRLSAVIIPGELSRALPPSPLRPAHLRSPSARDVRQVFLAPSRAPKREQEQSHT